MIAWARAADVPEQHDAGGRPRVGQLQTGAPEGVAGRSRSTVSPQRARSTQVPVALDRHSSGARALGNLDCTGELAPERGRHAQRRAGTTEVIRPGAAVDGDVGRPLRVLGIDAALRAESENRAELIGGGRRYVGPEPILLTERMRQREVGALERAALPLGVQANR